MARSLCLSRAGQGIPSPPPAPGSRVRCSIIHHLIAWVMPLRSPVSSCAKRNAQTPTPSSWKRRCSLSPRFVSSAIHALCALGACWSLGLRAGAGGGVVSLQSSHEGFTDVPGPSLPTVLSLWPNR